MPDKAKAQAKQYQQTFFVIMDFVLTFATVIALPIGATIRRKNAEFIFTRLENGTTWPKGWGFVMSWLSPIWVIVNRSGYLGERE